MHLLEHHRTLNRHERQIALRDEIAHVLLELRELVGVLALEQILQIQKEINVVNALGEVVKR